MKVKAEACSFNMYLRLLDMGEPPKPNTRACSMPQRRRASRGGSIPSAHSRGRKRNSTWRTWLASWSSGTGPENLNQDICEFYYSSKHCKIQ